MVSLTKQDVQNVIDNARNRWLERVATRQDVHALQDTVRLLTTALQQSQQLLRQDETHRVQLVRRSIAIETRLTQLDHELQNVRRTLVQLSQHQPTDRVTERVIMAQPEKALRGYSYGPVS